MSPYRSQPQRVAAHDPDSNSDRQLVPVFALLWLASLVRVALGALGHETFGAEATVALGAVVVLPILAWPGIRALFR